MALQMSWQLHLKKRKNGPPLGFKNLGNTCYLNSVLQCLTYTPPLANFCLKLQHTSLCDLAGQEDKKSECPLCLVEKRIARSLSIDLTLDTPGKIISGLKIFAKHFCLGRQEDAHEFLRYVIDACHTTCLRLKKLQQQRRKFVSNGGGGSGNGGGSAEGWSSCSVVKEIFGGALQSQVKCLTCGSESNKVDEIMDISLDVVNSSSLKEAFQKFFQPEILDGNNKYKCDKCMKLVSARKQMSIIQAPNVLVVQLKRFEGVFGGKIDKAVSFEEVLVLSSFICKESQDPHDEYNLFATIVHSGFSADSGHYYAYIKDAIGRWYCCNDSCVSLSTIQEVVSEKVYILFYTRTKQRHALSNNGLTTNGKKSHDCNRSDTSKILKAGPVENALVSQNTQNGNSTPKANNTHSTPARKLSSSDTSGNKKLPAAVNFKLILHKKESDEKDGEMKASISAGKSEKNVAMLHGKNGFTQNILVNGEIGKSFMLPNQNGKIQRTNLNPISDGCKNIGKGRRMEVGSGPSGKVVENGVISSEKSQSFPVTKQNGETQGKSVDSAAEKYEVDGTRNKLGNGKGFSGKEENGNVESQPDKPGPKRKLQEEDSCILFAQDAHSRTTCDDLNAVLMTEAASFLRSCGWSDGVYSFMRSNKKLCAQIVGSDASNIDELKRLMIADAKWTFIPQIPESLKASLIERLRAFRQENQSVGR